MNIIIVTSVLGQGAHKVNKKGIQRLWNIHLVRGDIRGRSEVKTP